MALMFIGPAVAAAAAAIVTANAHGRHGGEVTLGAFLIILLAALTFTGVVMLLIQWSVEMSLRRDFPNLPPRKWWRILD